MRVELLHIDECPNSAEAAQRVETALAALGHGDTAVHMRLLESSADTVGTAFAGSPTITVDGADIFPGGAPASDLACRIYRTSSGFAGLPTVDQLKEALKNHGF
ncbi:thioredoxin family protein [Arthrobacter sp. UYCu712]|uniref:thioredoxin family protein n=1 Tax=Arthrobacter sp. UYCu712 TaxID=3156340 RepID=UPI003399347D